MQKSSCCLHEANCSKILFSHIFTSPLKQRKPPNIVEACSDEGHNKHSWEWAPFTHLLPVESGWQIILLPRPCDAASSLKTVLMHSQPLVHIPGSMQGAFNFLYFKQHCTCNLSGPSSSGWQPWSVPEHLWDPGTVARDLIDPDSASLLLISLPRDSSRK